MAGLASAQLELIEMTTEEYCLGRSSQEFFRQNLGDVFEDEVRFREDLASPCVYMWLLKTDEHIYKRICKF